MNTLFESKFVTLIKKWSEEDLKAFDLWLKSPWCNSNKNLIKLFERLRKDYPEFNNRKLNKEKLFLQILPKGKFSVRRMNNLLSEAYLVAERFMVFQNFTKDQNLQKDLLTKEFQNRHLEDWFFRDIDKEIDRLEQKDIKEWEDHLALFQLHRRLYHHPNQNLRMQPGGQTIVRMGEQIDLIYLLEKALIINEKIFRNRILKNENHEINSDLKKWQVASEGVDHPALDFYRMRFAYSEKNRLEQYFKLRDVFLKRYEELSEKEQKVHFVSLLNDTTLLVRAGKIDITQFLPLYKIGLKTKFIFHRGQISYITYVKILVASNIKKDFSFSDNFIEVYSSNLDKQFQPDAVNWAKAHKSYYSNEYTNCLNYLLGHNFKIQYFQIISKLLTTQVYFDLFLSDDSYQEYLMNYFDSFERWISREKFRSDAIKKSYLRFIQVCRALSKCYTEADFPINKVETLLEKETNIQAHNWLTRKKDDILSTKQAGRLGS